MQFENENQKQKEKLNVENEETVTLWMEDQLRRKHTAKEKKNSTQTHLHVDRRETGVDPGATKRRVRGDNDRTGEQIPPGKERTDEDRRNDDSHHTLEERGGRLTGDLVNLRVGEGRYRCGSRGTHST